MSTTTRMAWRNLWRHRRRTVLLLLAIAFCTAVLIFFMALQLKSYDTAVKASVSLLSGHIQIQVPGYLERPQMRKSFSGHDVEKKLGNVTGIAEYAPRAVGYALLSSDERTYGASVLGVIPEREGGISTIPSLVRSGRFLEKLDALEVVIGKTLAANLKLGVGEDLTLLGQGRDGSLAASVLTIVGIFESGSADIDRSLIEIPLGTFQETFGMGDHIHAYVVTIGADSELEVVRNAISSNLSDQKLMVLTWNEIIPGLKQSIELDMTFGWMFYCSLVIVVVFSILNTFLMSVLERIKEFGIMLSLGARHRSIAGMVIMECLFISLIGLGLGIVLGAAVVEYYRWHGFSVPGSEEILRKWNLPSTIHPVVTARVLVSCSIVILAANLISIVYPALKILSLTPARALKNA